MGVGQNEVDWYWTSSGWMYDWATNFFNHTAVPDSVSISWGWAEDGQCSSGIDSTVCTTLGVSSEQYVQRVNTEFQKIGLRGVSLLIASGDSGANGRSDPYCSAKTLKPGFPGASPYVTTVGATEVKTSTQQFNVASPPPACSQFECISGGSEEAVSY